MKDGPTPIIDAAIAAGYRANTPTPPDVAIAARKLERDQELLIHSLELIRDSERSQHAHQYCKGVARTALALVRS